MESVTIQLSSEIDPQLVPEIEKQSAYISRGLRQFRVTPDRTRVLVSFENENKDEVCSRVQRFVESMRRGFRPLDLKVVARNERRNTQPYETDVFRKLVKKGWVLDLGQGQVALAGPAIALAAAIDRSVAKIGRERFKGVERAYPMLIPAEVLARCGYTSSFPQHLSIVTHLHEDFDDIEEFRRANTGSGALKVPNPSAFGLPKVCLCPALCYHTYPTLEKQKLGKEGHVETAIGRIARYESSGMIGLDRLWDFTQRSIIWVGDDEFCSIRRQWAMDAAIELAAAWDIDCTIETASDPFFASVSTAKSFWQRAQDLKFELRAAIEPDAERKPRTLAAASFNLHGTFFGHAFDIAEYTGQPAFSGCASWGLERLVLVICTQHGLDPDNWSSALRAAIAS
jgi:ribosomal protein L34E